MLESSVSSTADATRSQVVLREVEERFWDLHVITYQRFMDIRGELTHIQDSMTQISRQMVELMHYIAGSQGWLPCSYMIHQDGYA